MALRTLIFLTAFYFILPNAQAQTWEVGGSLGGAGYIGDINPINPVKISGASASLFVKRNIDAYFGVSANYNFGHIQGYDSKSPSLQQNERNLSFRNSLHEFSLQLEFNFLDYFSGGGTKKLSPYLFAGGGIVFFNPKTTYAGSTYELSRYHTEGPNNVYKTHAITIPYGAGVRYNLRESLTIFSQVGYRTAFTDYLDDVSGRYPGAGAFTVDEVTNFALSDRSGETNGVYIGATGTQRGDLRKRDTYMFVGIGITYTFVSSKCY